MENQTNLFRSTNLPSLRDCFLVWNDLGLSEIVDQKKKKRRNRKRVGGLSFQVFFFFFPSTLEVKEIFVSLDMIWAKIWYEPSRGCLISICKYFPCSFILSVNSHNNIWRTKDSDWWGRWTRLSYLNVWFCKFLCLYITRNEVSNLLLWRMMV